MSSSVLAKLLALAENSISPERGFQQKSGCKTSFFALHTFLSVGVPSCHLRDPHQNCPQSTRVTLVARWQLNVGPYFKWSMTKWLFWKQKKDKLTQFNSSTKAKHTNDNQRSWRREDPSGVVGEVGENFPAKSATQFGEHKNTCNSTEGHKYCLPFKFCRESFRVLPLPYGWLTSTSLPEFPSGNRFRSCVLLAGSEVVSPVILSAEL